MRLKNFWNRIVCWFTRHVLPKNIDDVYMFNTSNAHMYTCARCGCRILGVFIDYGYHEEVIPGKGKNDERT